MIRKLFALGLVLNVSACLGGIAAIFYASVLLTTKSCTYVTALDRAGVISEARLREFDPNLAQHIRRNLGPYITQAHQRFVLHMLWIGIGLTASNIVLFVGLRHLGRASESRTREACNMLSG